MAHAMLKVHPCECGLILIVGQPEHKELLQKLVDSSDIESAVVLLDTNSATCPRCSKVYMLPPAETFDPERSYLGRLIIDIENAHPDDQDSSDDDIQF